MKVVMFSIFSAIIIVLSILIQCSNENPANINASNQNPVISGILYGIDGSICNNATVQMRPKSSLADTLQPALGKRVSYSLSTTTDGSGKFSFDANLDPDIYVIDAKSGNSAVLIDSVKVLKKDSNIVLAAATLKPVGAIKGKVKLSSGDDPQSIYVLAFGINRFTRVNADGSFLFGDLAEGNYKLRLISSLINHTAFDTATIAVFSKETTDVKTLTLPYRDLSVPRNLVLTYDTMQQVVTLHWDKLNNAKVIGYNIYRRHVDFNESFALLLPYDSTVVNDTVFTDSTCIQDKTYDYCISAKMKDGQEGVKSDARKITISSYLTVDTVFNLFENNSTELFDYFSISSAGDFYIPYERAKFIQVFDSMMNPKSQIVDDIWQFDGICISEERVYALQYDPEAPNNDLFTFTTTGSFIDTFLKTFSHNVINIDVNKDFLAAMFSYRDSTGKGDSIALFSKNGTLQKSWTYDRGEFKPHDFIFADSNKFYILLSSQELALSKIVAYDLQGNKLSEKSIPLSYLTYGMAFDTQRQLLYVVCDESKYYDEKSRPQDGHQKIGTVYVFDPNYSVVALYHVFDGQGINSLKVHNGNCFIGVQGKGGPRPVKTRIIKLKPVQRL